MKRTESDAHMALIMRKDLFIYLGFVELVGLLTRDDQIFEAKTIWY